MKRQKTWELVEEEEKYFDDINKIPDSDRDEYSTHVKNANGQMQAKKSSSSFPFFNGMQKTFQELKHNAFNSSKGILDSSNYLGFKATGEELNHTNEPL